MPCAICRRFVRIIMRWLPWVHVWFFLLAYLVSAICVFSCYASSADCKSVRCICASESSSWILTTTFTLFSWCWLFHVPQFVICVLLLELCSVPSELLYDFALFLLVKALPCRARMCLCFFIPQLYLDVTYAHPISVNLVRVPCSPKPAGFIHLLNMTNWTKYAYAGASISDVINVRWISYFAIWSWSYLTELLCVLIADLLLCVYSSSSWHLLIVSVSFYCCLCWNLVLYIFTLFQFLWWCLMLVLHRIIHYPTLGHLNVLTTTIFV